MKLLLAIATLALFIGGAQATSSPADCCGGGGSCCFAGSACCQ